MPTAPATACTARWPASSGFATAMPPCCAATSDRGATRAVPALCRRLRALLRRPQAGAGLARRDRWLSGAAPPAPAPRQDAGAADEHAAAFSRVRVAPARPPPPTCGQCDAFSAAAVRHDWQRGALDAGEVQTRVQGWIAHARHAYTVRLRHTLFKGGWFDPTWSNGQPVKSSPPRETPRPARRRLEQQPRQRPFRQPQQERTGQPQQQHRFPPGPHPRRLEASLLSASRTPGFKEPGGVPTRVQGW